VIAGPIFWEFPPPMGFTYPKAWGKNLHRSWGIVGGGILCLLIGVRTLPLLRCRHNIPPFLGGKLMDIRCHPNTLQIFSKCFTKTKQPQAHFVMPFKKNSPDILWVPARYPPGVTKIYLILRSVMPSEWGSSDVSHLRLCHRCSLASGTLNTWEAP
jgi:hypothetical protein